MSKLQSILRYLAVCLGVALIVNALIPEFGWKAVYLILGMHILWNLR